MGLRLRQVTPRQGSQWLRAGLQIFVRQPLAFCALFVAFLGLAALTLLVPLVGPLLFIGSFPLLSLVFMLATREAMAGGRVRFGHLLALWREPPPRRRTMLLLCLMFGALVAGIGMLAFWSAGDDVLEALKTLKSSEGTPADIMAVLSLPAVTRARDTAYLLYALLSIPYWHALALVHWGGQSAGQALFSSTLALWRTKGAFAVYCLGWLGTAVLATLVTTLIGALLSAATGTAALAALLTAALSIALSAAFYVSLWFMFADSFGAEPDSEPAAPGVTPPA